MDLQFVFCRAKFLQGYEVFKVGFLKTTELFLHLGKLTDPIEDQHDQGCLEVIDDENGMAHDVVKTVWLDPATPDKLKNRVSPRFERRVLGEKGILCSIRATHFAVRGIKRPSHISNRTSLVAWSVIVAPSGMRKIRSAGRLQKTGSEIQCGGPRPMTRGPRCFSTG